MPDLNQLRGQYDTFEEITTGFGCYFRDILTQPKLEPKMLIYDMSSHNFLGPLTLHVIRKTTDQPYQDISYVQQITCKVPDMLQHNSMPLF